MGQLHLLATLGPVGNVLVGLKGDQLCMWEQPRGQPHLPVRSLSLEQARTEKVRGMWVWMGEESMWEVDGRRGGEVPGFYRYAKAGRVFVLRSVGLHL
jgi:hypothetical protein